MKTTARKKSILYAIAYGLILAALAVLIPQAMAQDDGKIDLWALCQPDSWVCVRSGAGTDKEVTGYLYLGDKVTADDTAGAWWHVTGVSSEAGQGWVHGGYMTASEPTIYPEGKWCTVEANGRVAARRAMNGDIRMWLRPEAGMYYRVWADGGEWLVTDAGFVAAEYMRVCFNPRDSAGER